LAHMLRGLNAEQDPRMVDYERAVNNLQVIYEDEHLMLVNKPSGLLSVPGKEYLPSVESITQCLSVHRLDQDTSGILLLAKNQEVQKLLRAQFEQRLTQKQYEAILEGEMPIGQEGELTLPLRPDIDNRPKQVVDHVNGKSALTKYRVTDNRDGHAHVILWPHTGRTHQLRVHMAQGLHNPILNDRLYGNVATASGRLMLHASMLSFTHPITLEPMTFTCTPEWREPQD
jgi:tRNA pseudouridine32 synthase/23S rRNA pseudouridine746 synthase